MKDVKVVVENFARYDDQAAFRQFYMHYYAKLFRFSLYYVRHEVIAEEVIADVFVKIWNNRIRMLEIDNLDIYLFTSVKNQSLSYLKRKNMLLAKLEKYDSIALINRYNPERELIGNELIEKVNQAINLLPPKCQVIFKLSRDEGFKYDEIADILGLSKSTVKNQMTSALAKIKDELSSYFEDDKEVPTYSIYPARSSKSL
ncbi:MAG: RNA polymerase sigma-70 factor [Cyclobacteriaceae bacterium]|nr:RNA polymerase sigma-70 factor [Cyclobacteriaceae bacterium]